MPILLSPRSAAKGPEEDATATKKPKGVMGRIKSTFKLGRRKSSSSSDPGSVMAAAAAAAQANDREDAESKQDNDSDRTDEKDTDEDSPHDDALPSGPVVTTEVKAFSVKEEEAVESHEQQAQAKASRVSTFEMPTPASNDSKLVDEEEVFACDYEPGQGLQMDDDKKPVADEDDDDVEVFANASSSNQISGPMRPPDSPPARVAKSAKTAPRESDLMIVGVSPGKYRATDVSGPSASPIKRSQPPVPTKQESDEIIHDAGAPEGDPSCLDTEQSLGDRIASAHSTRPSCQPTLPVSPARRSQLLCDFQFGTEGPVALNGTHSPVPSSPMRRRSSGAGSSPALPPRRSFSRDQEQQLSINATASPSPAASPSPKRKPDTPSGAPSLRASRPERRPSSLQGIAEDDGKPLEESPVRPPRPSAHTGSRRAVAMDALILASSFMASAPAPEVHDDSIPSITDRDEEEGDLSERGGEEKEADASGAFAFDAGAAITQEFGERVARLLGADPWGDRQDGFDAILYQIKKTDLATAKNKRELFCAAIAAVQCGVEDRVAPVMYCALDCLKGVLKEFAPAFDRSFLKFQPLNEQLSGLTKAIVAKLSDSNKRTQREASQTILRLAKLKKLKVLPHILLHLNAKEVTPRQRVDTLRQLVSELGVDGKTVMNVEVVMQFAMPVLKIADEKSRKAAVELIAELHMINGQAVNAQLVGVKPEMLRVINRRVDELIAKRDHEREQQQLEQQQRAAQNANQAEDAADDGDATMVLVAVPVEDSKAVHALLEACVHQAQTIIGPVAWRKLESKTWSDRKEALVDMDKTITEAKSDLRDVKPAFNSVVQHNFIAYCTVVHKCLSDSIAPVVNSAMDCFATLVKIYGPCVEWREENVKDMTLLTIMRLFTTMQKPNNRANRAACRCILKLTRLTNPHTLRYALSCVFAKDTDPLVQMHLLRLLVPEFGFQSDGISASQVLELTAAALAHSNDKVRKIAMDVALCTQRLMGKEFVLKNLKDVVKPVVWKELEKNFVDLEVQKDSERPQTVHATAVPSSALPSVAVGGTLPPVQFGGGGEHSRRLLNSAPVGQGRLHCTPPTVEDREADMSASYRRSSVLSNDEESLMDSILGSDDF